MTGLFDSNDAPVAASEVAHPYVGRFVRRQGSFSVISVVGLGRNGFELVKDPKRLFPKDGNVEAQGVALNSLKPGDWVQFEVIKNTRPRAAAFKAVHVRTLPRYAVLPEMAEARAVLTKVGWRGAARAGLWALRLSDDGIILVNLELGEDGALRIPRLERNKVHLAKFCDDRVASVPKEDVKEDVYFYDHSAPMDTLDWSSDVDHIARVIASLTEANDPHIADLINWLELDRGDHASRVISANIDHAAARAALRSGELAERLRSDHEVMQAYLDAVIENPQVRDAVAMWAREGHSEETKRLREQLNQELELTRSTGVARITEQLEAWRAEEFARVEAEVAQREKICLEQQEARLRDLDVASLERLQAMEAEFDRRREALELAAAQQTRELDIVRAETEAAKATLESIKSDESKARERLTAVNSEVDRQLLIASRLDVSSTSSSAAIAVPAAYVTHIFRAQPRVSVAAKGALIAKQPLLTEHGKQLMHQLTMLMLAGELPLLTGKDARDLLTIAEALLCPGRSASIEADPTIISVEDLWSRPGSGAPTALAAAASASVDGGGALVVIRGAERSAARVWHPALADALRSGGLPRGLLVACLVDDLDHDEIKALPRDTHLIAAEGACIEGAHRVGPTLLSPPNLELTALDPGEAPVDLSQAESLLLTLGFELPLGLSLRLARLYLEGLALLGTEGAAQSMVKNIVHAMKNRTA